MRGPSPVMERCSRCRKVMIRHRALRHRGGLERGGVKWTQKFLVRFKGFQVCLPCYGAVRGFSS